MTNTVGDCRLGARRTSQFVMAWGVWSTQLPASVVLILDMAEVTNPYRSSWQVAMDDSPSYFSSDPNVLTRAGVCLLRTSWPAYPRAAIAEATGISDFELGHLRIRLPRLIAVMNDSILAHKL